MVKKSLLLLPLLALLLPGCATTTITNLTPQHATRNANGLYPVEAALGSRQQSLRWDSVRPQVIVDQQVYPMRTTALMTNRWETLIPVPAGKNVIFYRIKFDFNYNAFGKPPTTDSALSKVYKLQILDN